MMTTEAKKNKLLHYAGKPLTEFYQYDAFFDVPGDCVMHRDEDGMCVMSTKTKELMTGAPSVRVLVTRGQAESPDKVVLALRKIAKSIETHGLPVRSPDLFELMP